jgi:signal transduction histidine kinase
MKNLIFNDFFNIVMTYIWLRYAINPIILFNSVEFSFTLTFTDYSFLMILPLSWIQVLIKFGAWRQHLYNSILLFVFSYSSLLSFIIIKYHLILFYFRIWSENIGRFIEKYIYFSTFCLFIGLLLSRLHLAGYAIFFCLVFLRLDFAVVAMCRFYRSHPDIFRKNFPQSILPHTRSMWTRVSQAVVEASSNPQVQGAAVLVTGALAWKVLDVYEVSKQEDISEEDRLAEAARQKEAEAARQKEALEAEALERKKDRQEENRRLAFDKMSSSDFNALSDEQKKRIVETVETGEIKF